MNYLIKFKYITVKTPVYTSLQNNDNNNYNRHDAFLTAGGVL